MAFAGSTALDTVKIPMPPNLGDFVKDKKAAIQLGKALFWDQQVGGDGGQACASCHYRAGADPYDVRKTNQVNPGPNGAFNVVSGPNQTPADSAFPFVQVSNPATAKLENGLGVADPHPAAARLTRTTFSDPWASPCISSPDYPELRWTTGPRLMTRRSTSRAG